MANLDVAKERGKEGRSLIKIYEGYYASAD